MLSKSHALCLGASAISVTTFLGWLILFRTPEALIQGVWGLLAGFLPLGAPVLGGGLLSMARMMREFGHSAWMLYFLAVIAFVLAFLFTFLAISGTLYAQVLANSDFAVGFFLGLFLGSGWLFIDRALAPRSA